MQLQPALLDSAPDAGAELRAACLERVEEWVVDLLDMDSAVLYCLDARSQLNELTRGDYGIGKKAFGDVLHRWNQNLKRPCLASLARDCHASSGGYAQILRKRVEPQAGDCSGR